MSDGREGINRDGGFFHNTNDGYAPFSVKKQMINRLLPERGHFSTLQEILRTAECLLLSWE